MDKQAILERLREHERALRDRGIRRVALFGSRARGEAQSKSDIDIMIEIEPDAVQDIYAYVGLKRFVAALFDEPVDVVDEGALKMHVGSGARRDAVYAF